MQITVINFSGRADGNCHNISKMIRASYPDLSMQVFGFCDLEITPCGKCRYECFTKRELCPYFDEQEYAVCEAVTQSDAAIFIVPNYCDYPCANFFLFNERSQCYFQGREDLLERYLQVKKLFIVVSNTGKENFISAFRYHVAEDTEPDILFMSSKKYGKSSIAGDLMEAEDARKSLKEYLKDRIGE